MNAFLLLCCISYASAQFEELLNGSLIHFGPYDDLIKIGNLTNHDSSISNDDLTASRNAGRWIEEARRMFSVGFQTLPPLDPFKRSELPPMIVDKRLEPLSGIIHLNNFEMTGAKRFNLNKVEVRLKNGRIDYGFTLPALSVNVEVQTDLLIMDLIPVIAKGHLSLTLSKISVLGAAQVVPKVISKKYVYQLSALYNRVHIEDVTFQFNGSQINVNEILRVSPVASSAVESLVPSILDILKEKLNELIANVLFEDVNKVLTGATISQILAYLLSNIVVF